MYTVKWIVCGNVIKAMFFEAFQEAVAYLAKEGDCCCDQVILAIVQ